MKHFKTLTLSVFAVSMALTATAQEKREKPNAWVDCGIGAMIFPSDNLEVAAAVSNIIWDLGTTAVTSALSSPESCSGLDNVEMAVFIQSTYASLESDLAKGEGDNLSALAELANVEDKDAFVVALREEYAVSVASGNANAEALYYAAEAVI